MLSAASRPDAVRKKQDIKFEIGSVHSSDDKEYLCAPLQGDTVREVVEKRYKSCSSYGSRVFKVDWSQAKRVRPTYGMVQRPTMMPLILECLGDYTEQGLQDLEDEWERQWQARRAEMLAKSITYR